MNSLYIWWFRLVWTRRAHPHFQCCQHCCYFSFNFRLLLVWPFLYCFCTYCCWLLLFIASTSVATLTSMQLIVLFCCRRCCRQRNSSWLLPLWRSLPLLIVAGLRPALGWCCSCCCCCRCLSHCRLLIELSSVPPSFPLSALPFPLLLIGIFKFIGVIRAERLILCRQPRCGDTPCGGRERIVKAAFRQLFCVDEISCYGAVASSAVIQGIWGLVTRQKRVEAMGWGAICGLSHCCCVFLITPF